MDAVSSLYFMIIFGFVKGTDALFTWPLIGKEVIENDKSKSIRTTYD